MRFIQDDCSKSDGLHFFADEARFSGVRHFEFPAALCADFRLLGTFRFLCPFCRFKQAVQRLIGGDGYKGGLFDVGGDPFRLFETLKPLLLDRQSRGENDRRLVYAQHHLQPEHGLSGTGRGDQVQMAIQMFQNPPLVVSPRMDERDVIGKSLHVISFPQARLLFFCRIPGSFLPLFYRGKAPL
jgi:hypothetical protein